jgi:hypothetical protein
MLDAAELDEHCQCILKSRRILNKIVILCEGRRIERGQRPSVSIYSRMENSPDANFYRACLPVDWRNFAPQFFNCGDRTDVLNTYRRLLELHADPPLEGDYLSPDLLFALVDSDLSKAKIQDYHRANTEEIFSDLYQKLRLQQPQLAQHHIWVTGFKHKEAYFLNPAVQQILQDYPCPLYYQGKPIQLADIYQDMAQELSADGNLGQNLGLVAQRLDQYSDILNLNNPQSFQKSWQQQWLKSNDDRERTELVRVLLAIAHSKTYWQRITDPDPNVSAAKVRDALLLEIAKTFYAQSTDTVEDEHHLPGLWGYLQKLK